MTDFVALKCPACGGRLEVFNDMNAFACGYCGNALTTRCRGGTISLSLEEAVESVAANTDRTAAELAMARLTKELEEAAGTVQYLEQHEKDVAWSFDQKDLMSEADADAAAHAVTRLRVEVEQKSLPLVVGLYWVTAVLISIFAVAAQSGVFRTLIAVVVAAVGSFILFGVVMMITMAINTRREDKLRELEQQLHHHEIALERSQELAEIRAELQEARATIARVKKEMPHYNAKLSIGRAGEPESSRV